MAKLNINCLEFCKYCGKQEDDLIDNTCISCASDQASQLRDTDWMDWDQSAFNQQNDPYSLGGLGNDEFDDFMGDEFVDWSSNDMDLDDGNDMDDDDIDEENCDYREPDHFYMDYDDCPY